MKVISAEYAKAGAVAEQLGTFRYLDRLNAMAKFTPK